MAQTRARDVARRKSKLDFAALARAGEAEKELLGRAVVYHAKEAAAETHKSLRVSEQPPPSAPTARGSRSSGSRFFSSP